MTPWGTLGLTADSTRPTTAGAPRGRLNGMAHGPPATETVVWEDTPMHRTILGVALGLAAAAAGFCPLGSPDYGSAYERDRPAFSDPALVLERGRLAVARSSRTRMTFQLAHAMEPGTARDADPDPLTR